MKKIWDVFWRFLLLGCISFGGPAAHIGYFQRTFVQKLAWLSNDAYAKLISISHILPGPASSQIGFAIGLQKAGLAGGIAAFVGFTLPSFILMYWLAVSVNLDNPANWLVSVSSGLKLLAVVVVLDAVITMFRSFCKSLLSFLIMLLSIFLLILYQSFYSQMLVLLIALLIGIFSTNTTAIPFSVGQGLKKISWLPVLLFIGLFLMSLGLSQDDSLIGLFATFYKNGSLVFGGGHVVLPLLQTSVGNTLTEQPFLFGYAAAQGMPGPMFTMATFMGAQWLTSTPLIGAIFATLAIFLPGFLLILTINKSWQSLVKHPKFISASASINAAVVGFLALALYDPVFIHAVHSYFDLGIVMIGYLILKIFRPPILLLIGVFIGLKFY
ncbi:chromate efflux transporter [uncultured Paraglaciecola sp.]|uniref:chromate efflux transporter n=1 Tax=uncultured Paraglaciecola sp. TaxID=1765024 RepID=UPI0030DAA66C|tara:strand:- start:81368 stop:82516 length:1149 start_codon:yes stop_codon:yes gene_type:complete